jgi:RND superfamily putative drug exporter
VERLTQTVIAHRRAVLAVWLVLFLVSGAAAAGLSDLLTNRFTLPGTDTERTEQALRDHFGQRSTGAFTLVASSRAADARRLVPEVRRAAGRAAAVLPTAQVVDVRPVSEHVVVAQIVSDQEPAEAKRYTDDMRGAVGRIAGAAEVMLTGQAATEHDLDPVFARDLKVGELYIAIPLALLLLVFVFGTLAFLIPFVFAAFSITVTLGIVWIFANVFELTTYLQNMVMLIGLGIAIDYSLFVVYRYREEHAVQPSREEALVRTMATAGRAVVFSGTAVAIGLAILLFMPLPFMRGFGVSLVIPLVSVACAVTLLPVLLYWLGDRLDRVHLLPPALERRRAGNENFWVQLARTIMRRPLVYAAAATGLLLAMASPVLALELGPGSNAGIPQNLEAMRGLNTITGAVGEGAIAPTEVVIDTGRAGGARDPAVEAALTRLLTQLRGDPEVKSVVFGAGAQYVDPTGRYLHVQTTGTHEYGTPAAMDSVHRLRDDYVPAAGFPPGVRVLAGGGPPSGVDFLDLTYGTFPWLVAAVLLVTYLLLLRAFRSLLLPLKAIVLNLLAIGAAYGMLVAVFKWGWGSWAGITAYDQIEGWIPVFLFAMLFGLSMDYEVFLVSRMREEWDRTHDNVQAVSIGLAKTGRLVTVAGLVMVAAFAGFVAGSVVGLQQFGFGLAVAVLVDVTIIRALLVPSAMAVFGRWNWWLPEGVAKLLRTKSSPLVPPAAAVRG